MKKIYFLFEIIGVISCVIGYIDWIRYFRKIYVVD